MGIYVLRLGMVIYTMILMIVAIAGVGETLVVVVRLKLAVDLFVHCWLSYCFCFPYF